MISKLLFSALLLLLAGLFEACNDKLSTPDEFAGSLFSRFSGKWLNHKLKTAPNKWKNGDPEQGPAWGFWLLSSSHAFVFLSDAWHFTQFLYQTSLQGLALIWILPELEINPIWGALLLLFCAKLLQGAVFTLFYHKILR